ncbi:sensor histidine kinase [Cryomorpha ignava]|uniref:histidine kinase n=1 Tax=Cryomorpha ignava TaxID=101383 RepID=A0A7K3WPJ1_9FLAO|nr:ATP-binding protein [Cryomorpha ignava]NEN22951.1 sensor histidine kinase [Cryomorpha ignava]
MKDLSPRYLTLVTALIFTAISAVAIIGISFLPGVEIHAEQIFIGLIIIFLGAWFALYKILQAFIYDKIKLIFRNMHSLKIERDSLKPDMSKDVLGEVNEQVIDWAEDRMAEIKDLRQKENFRKEFVGNVAHELKTPIFSIQGYILTLLEGALEDPNFNRKFLKKAAKSAERMAMLVEDLDTITQFESGNLKLELERVDIVELSREIMDGREREAEQKEIVLGFSKSYDRPIYVQADGFRISQVLTNLITNSINYGKKGGKTTIHFYDLDEQILIEVEDDGPGITKPHQGRLFERFYRVDKSRARHQGGTGLGLAICKHIIEAHKQSISVRSEPGKGAVFSFTLAKA